MTKEEARLEFLNCKEVKSFYMMGTLAYHQLGDLSRDEEDLFRVSGETDENYIGSWVEGYGFFGVVFPKSTSRSLTPEEIEKYSNMSFGIAGSGFYNKITINTK